MQTDRSPILRVELSDASGVIDLTDAAVFFVYRNKYSGVAPISGAATIISATGGTVEYAWTTNDTQSPNVYYGFWRISGDNGKWSSHPNDSYLRFVINPIL